MKKYAVIGYPVEHSLSPQLHTEICRRAKITATFERLTVAPAKLEHFVQNNALAGYNVTHPHKETIVPLLDELDDHARLLKAVNCVKKKGDNSIGYNTDWLGFERALKGNQVKVRHRPCLVLGAGGVARSVAYTLTKFQPERIVIANRTAAKAHHLVKWLRRFTDKPTKAIPLSQTAAWCKRVKKLVIINCTPVGMWPLIDAQPLPSNSLHSGLTLLDTVYNPLETNWLRAGRKGGARVLGGLDMFIYQGLASAEIWFEEPLREVAIVETLRNSLRGLL